MVVVSSLRRMQSAPRGIREPVTTATAWPDCRTSPALSAGLAASALRIFQGPGPHTANPSMAEVAQCGIG